MLPVEIDSQSAFSVLPAVVDADVFYVDSPGSQDGGKHRNRSGLIYNIHGEGIVRTYRAMSPAG